MIDEEFKCLREPENQHSENATSVYSKKMHQKMEIVGPTHQESALGKAVHLLMSEWTFLERKD